MVPMPRGRTPEDAVSCSITRCDAAPPSACERTNISTSSTGTVAVSLEDWILALRKMDLVSLEVRVMEALRFDHTIVATVDAQWKLRFMGHAIDERVLLTDVWVKFDEGWQVIRRHSSPDPPGVSIE